MRGARGESAADVSVFVDPSGRRRRLVKRAGVVLALLGAGYGAVLVVFAVTGVRIDAPGLPVIERPFGVNRPAAPIGQTPKQRHSRAPSLASGDGSPTSGATTAATGQTTPSATPTSGPGKGKSVGQSARATPVSTVSTSTASTSTNGSSATAPGASNRPTATAHGNSSTAPGASKKSALP